MRIMHIKCTIKIWSDKFQIADPDSKFQNLLPSFFYSIAMDGEKEFRKYSCLTLNKGMLLWFLVVRVDKALGIISKR